MRVLSFGQDVEVVEPEELRREVAEEVRRMVGMYASRRKADNNAMRRKKRSADHKNTKCLGRGVEKGCCTKPIEHWLDQQYVEVVHGYFSAL